MVIQKSANKMAIEARKLSAIQLTTVALAGAIATWQQPAHATSIEYISSSSGYLLYQDPTRTTAITAAWEGQAKISNFNGYGRIKINGRCLTGENQGQLTWQKCKKGSAAQTWGITNEKLLRNELGWCADLANNQNGAGAPIFAWSCHGAINQQWNVHRKASEDQVVYFIDGTNSAFKQRNLLHQLSKQVIPNGQGKAVRYVAGIDTLRGDGIEEVYKLTIEQVNEDTRNGMRQFYFLGYSRGALVALNVARKLCGESQLKWQPSAGTSPSSGDSNSIACDGIRAIALIDPVDTSIGRWDDTQINRLKSNTLVISKSPVRNREILPVLQTKEIFNVDNTTYLENANHSEMICHGIDRPSSDTYTISVMDKVSNFLRERGLAMKTPLSLQHCISSDGAWPPCLVTNGEIKKCATEKSWPVGSQINWQLNTW